MFTENFDIFLDSDEFGSTVVHSVAGTIIGIFGHSWVKLNGIDTQAPNISIKSSDAADMSTGDSLTVDGVSYVVREFHRNTESNTDGITTVILTKA